ncbi:molybdate ABC transporter substrate-binding protein [Paenibacillus thalictri]|uniref:Molybdate ABC transporter substrate-binding protein n=1 Tax=Paenibacillus thalictri TaxID=2527873 RepID=A0A4Q9E2C4_9BACL|nr:molybdate ABC transporter substrate-binding protein [Paenibacillus thalictri]TBL81781.1 molybdate ABC transporter substrate-binding protein [Paenibacillus thalictri]
MKKRWIAATAAFIVIAGCSAKQEQAAPLAAAPPAKAPPAAAPAKQTELTVSAAASLTDALKELQTSYEQKHPNVKLQYNFGASGTLQQQIEQGAPADLFISAGQKQMSTLVDKGLVDKADSSNLLGNELVVVINKEKPAAVRSLTDLNQGDVKKIAVGEPETVPAGSYAKEALTKAALWTALQPKLLAAKDVRQVLTYVETGNAEAGFVYRSDTYGADKVNIAFAVDPKTHSPIVYPAGIVKSTKHRAEAQELYQYLQSKEAADLFVKYGFKPAAEAQK